MRHSRRTFLAAPALAAAAAEAQGAAISVDPKPLFDIAPTLYMQFMEPLGVTDSSVEACWDYEADDWRKDFVEVTRDLKPGMMRYGGNYSRYYKWREGVGPVKSRPWMLNYDWGGKETNRVGTHEFVDFSRRVGAEPMYCVNFLGDGHKEFRNTPHEGNRTGDAKEAADWVSYANDPDDKLRIGHGHREPYRLRYWQIGNETSYSREGFPRDEAIRHTIDFAKAMRERDRNLQLIGWGDWDRGHGSNELRAAAMAERAGEHLDMIAIHLMGQRPRRPDTVLRGLRYQAAPETAWAELLELADIVEKRVSSLEQALAATPKLAMAITEGHLSLAPHNANPVLLEWLSAAYHAKSMNIYQRHGAKVKIATLADFAGNRWTVNALMLQVPRGVSYLTPAGSVMRLFGRYNGTQGVAVTAAPSSLDIAASRTADRVFLHVLNKEYSRAVEASFTVAGSRIAGGTAYEIAPASPREYVSQDQPEAFKPVEKPVAAGAAWRFPARSVTAVELRLA